MTIFLYSEMEPFQNIILLKCYTFLLLLVILNETPAHVIQMKGLQLQVMQFCLFKMGKNILISNWIPKILFQFCYFRLLLGIEAEPL